MALLDELLRIAARNPGDTYFKVWGLMRQGMAYDAMGRRELATERYNQVLKMKDWADVHERAREYLKEPYGRGVLSASRSKAAPAAP